ncbi:MAG: hypothetical protein HQ512_04805 [Rhodospirillales bacterium]|nr:hypothetical protein [Rhodospirillales bacterium]
MADRPKYTLRAARGQDFEEISRLLAGLGLTVPESPEKIEALRRRLWEDNPALTDKNQDHIGWALEAEGAIVGFFGNIPRLYYFGETEITTAVAGLWGLEKPFRRQILNLADTYFQQPDAGLLVASTANEQAGRIFEHYDARRLPMPEYGNVLFWVTGVQGFLSAALRKIGVPNIFASLAAIAAAPVVSAGLVLGRRRPTQAFQTTLTVTHITVGEIGDDFDELWRRRLEGPDRLMACRDAKTLRWHFSPGSSQPAAGVLTCRLKGALEGYAALVRDDTSADGLSRLKIADVSIAGDDGNVFDALLGAAFENAQASGCHVLELTGLPPALRAHAEAWRPFVRQMPTWPFYYKTIDQALQETFAQGESWYVTAYDGDTTLL